jgi:hypothetical protein
MLSAPACMLPATACMLGRWGDAVGEGLNASWSTAGSCRCRLGSVLVNDQSVWLMIVKSKERGKDDFFSNNELSCFLATTLYKYCSCNNREANGPAL